MIDLAQAARTPNILAVLLFGSRARGDHEDGSDIDVAVFANCTGVKDLIETKRAYTATLDPRINVSMYSSQTALKMAMDGSLYLWHLKLEGRVLFQQNSWTEHLFSALCPYESVKALRDLNTFELVLGDVLDSLSVENHTVPFESATVFSVLRSMGMIYSMLDGRPNFSRSEAIRILQQDMGQEFPLSTEELDILLNAKLVYSNKRAASRVQLSTDRCKQQAKSVLVVLEFVRRRVYAELHQGS